MLKAENIHVSIGDKVILHGVNLQVAPGEMLAVLGPNGAGKSTLFRTLSGEIAYTGQVTLDGRDLHSWAKPELACRRAVLSQFAPMRMPFRAAEVVHMGRSPHSGHSGFSQDHEIVMNAMQLTDCSQLADRRMDTLSGGEQQRVHWARVLAQIWDPPVEGGCRYLFLDEPISSLDIAHQHTAMALARRMADEGIAVLIILHDLNIAAQYADSLLVLKSGNSIAYGSSEKVLNSATIQMAFEVSAVIEAHPTDQTPCVFVSRKKSG